MLVTLAAAGSVARLLGLRNVPQRFCKTLLMRSLSRPDAGGHSNPQIWNTFEVLFFKALKPGGLYSEFCSV